MNEYLSQTQGDYHFSMGRYMSEGWNLFKKGAGSYIGFTLILFAVVLFLNFIPYINILVQFIQTILLAGFFVYSYYLLRNRDDFGQFFEGFRSFGQIFIFQLILNLIFIPLFFIFLGNIFSFDQLDQFFNGQVDPEWITEEVTYAIETKGTMVQLLFILFMLLVLCVYSLYSFVLPLITLGKLNFWQAMEISRKTVQHNLLGFLGLYMLLAILLVIGSTLTCFLGIVVLLPYYNCVVHAAYEDIFIPDASEDPVSQ